MSQDLSAGQLLYQQLELVTTRSFVERAHQDPNATFFDLNVIPIDGPDGKAKLATKVFLLHNASGGSKGYGNMFKDLSLSDDDLSMIFDICRHGLLVKVWHKT